MDPETPDEIDESTEGTIPEIEEAIAADESKWSKDQGEDRGDGRDGNGRFAGADKKGQRTAAGDEDEETGQDETQPLTDGKPKQPNDAKPGEKEKPGDKPKTSSQDEKEKGEKSQDGEQGRDKRSAFAKNSERQRQTWETINREKAEHAKRVAAEEDRLKLEREQFEAQQRQAPVSQARGREEARFRDASVKFRALAAQQLTQAEQAEDAGEFEAADRYRKEAAKNEDLSKKAVSAAESVKQTLVSELWTQLAQDFPEAIDHTNPVSAELRKILRADRSLMADPQGLFRAALRAGRQTFKTVLGRLEKAEKAEAEASELRKQNEALTAKLNELKRRTSIPGGTANLSRDGADGPGFEGLSFEQQEAWIRGDMASRES